MGAQRYLARALAEHFAISEDEAREIVPLIEAVQLGDELSDALWPLIDTGDSDEALAALRAVLTRLSEAIAQLSAACAPLPLPDGVAPARAPVRRRLAFSGAGASRPEAPARHQPRRGDDVEAWLKRWRGMLGGSRWLAVDAMLDEYRLHADTGTPLDGDQA